MTMRGRRFRLPLTPRRNSASGDLWRVRVCRRVLSLVRMHAFEVGDHDVSVEDVTVLDARVFDDVVCDCVPVFTGEVTPTARAGLGVGHGEPGRRLLVDCVQDGVMTTRH